MDPSVSQAIPIEIAAAMDMAFCASVNFMVPPFIWWNHDTAFG
jgi:hypothetical protein